MSDTGGQKAAALKLPEKEVRLLKLGLFIAAVLFVFGLFLPMLTLTKFIWFKNSFSIISGIWELLKNGELILFVLVFSVSVVLPILKIGFMYKVLGATQSNSPRLLRHLQLMHDYGRWAMLDVMVVALLIVTVKLGAIASVEVHFGLYVFALAVLLIMLITHRIV